MGYTYKLHDHASNAEIPEGDMLVTVRDSHGDLYTIVADEPHGLCAGLLELGYAGDAVRYFDADGRDLGWVNRDGWRAP